MELKEVRKLAVHYCENNKCDYTYISFDNTNKFYLTEKEDRNTVFTVGKNGGLRTYSRTSYAAEFHKELKKRKNIRRKNGKRKITEIHNRGYEEVEASEVDK